MNTYLVVTKHQTRIYVAKDWCDLVNEEILVEDEDILSITRVPDNDEVGMADIY